jgi:hypothetical protein
MTMLFADAFALIAQGALVQVSDGSAEPAKATDAWKHWRHNNLEGRLIAKVDGPPRSLAFELPSEEIAPGVVSTPVYEIAEGGPHTFTETQPPDAAKLPAQAAANRSAAFERARLAKLRPEEIVAEAETRVLAALKALFPSLKISAAQASKLFPNARDEG